MNINDNSGKELATIKTTSEEQAMPAFNFAKLELDIDDYDSCEGGGCSV